MMALLQEVGLPGLFVISFLAATILPLGSELFLLALHAQGFAPMDLLWVAGTANVLGSCVNYFLGRFAGIWLIKHVWRVSDVQMQRAQLRMQRYGYAGLLLAWLPVMGDPLTLVAGVLRLNFIVFMLLVALGKFARYAFLLFVFA